MTDSESIETRENPRIELQRASAGSGKTFTLAKKFIWYFITIKEEGEPVRLRTAKELRDSLPHILAVTFTNKATNEMQQRIIEKLDALANPPLPLDPELKSPDYMRDFCRDLHVAPEKLSATCKEALKVLLDNYSEFNVSTIDSFFQRVLRTLSYETDINDSYQVELDTDYLSRVAVDATLDEVDVNPNSKAAYWVNLVMELESGKNWNLFQKKEPVQNRGVTPYKILLNSVKELESEQYKKIRGMLEDYFASGVDFPALYEELRENSEGTVDAAFQRLQDAGAEYESQMPEAFLEGSTRTDVGKIGRVVETRKFTGLSKDKDPDPKNPDAELSLLAPDHFDKKKVQDIARKDPAAMEQARGVYERLNSLYRDWVGALRSPAYREWLLYKDNLPFLGLLEVITSKRRDYLRDQNAVELGETSMILAPFITDTDAPFIYERLGSRLNHFLIDEFQDTSRMQWRLMEPLLSESLGRGYDSLIIGDAKQSIYRFRNADPSLITTEVPREFPQNVELLGDLPEHNTNWRSDPRVVQFNNSFFRFFTDDLNCRFPSTPENPRQDFAGLYGNVVQHQRPRKQQPSEEDMGYVEVRFFTKRGDKQQGEDEQPALSHDQAVARDVPLLVADMLKRGYRQSDIAVLVDTNKNGEDVINSFISYNQSLSDPESENSLAGGEEIRFVSEQSLKVNSSPAVRTIEAVLENIAHGSDPDENRRSWTDMACNFRFYVKQHPDTPLPEAMRAFLSEMNAAKSDAEGEKSDDSTAAADSDDALATMLRDMQSLALPALVEQILERFLPERDLKRDAIYIAAFQDIVIEYCESHPTDVASFMRWWSRKRRDAAVSSPEGTDAVQVMTIHKSKGLEFRCVIVPWANWDMADNVGKGKEWRWVVPSTDIVTTSQPLPPYIPVAVSKKMEHTAEQPLLIEYYDQVKLDSLNKAYVAFTRATSELYVFTELELPAKSGDSEPPYHIADALREFLSEGCAALHVEGASPDQLLPADTIDSENPDVVSVGVKPPHARKDKNDGRQAATVISGYDSIPMPSHIHYRDEDLPQFVSAEDVVDVDEYSRDPRSEGNIKHAVLENVRDRSDLPRAVRKLQLSGLLFDEEALQIEAQLEEALSNPEVARWFDASKAARIITERPLLLSGQPLRRPDRIVVYPSGEADLIDYKFGEIPRGKRHVNQVRKYMEELSDTGICKSVRGFIWYVNVGEIREVKPE